MTERDKFAHTPSGVCASEETVFGTAFVGARIFGREHAITDEMVQEYITEQEGEPLHDDTQFVIDEQSKLPPSRR